MNSSVSSSLRTIRVCLKLGLRVRPLREAFGLLRGDRLACPTVDSARGSVDEGFCPGRYTAFQESFSPICDYLTRWLSPVSGSSISHGPPMMDDCVNILESPAHVIAVSNVSDYQLVSGSFFSRHH